ncbi:MAG: hypothetical protein H8D39_00015 [Candidatus Atribacteria bacterium]|nr:hypothetical protein [Candidatus Atribacteria bacterium]
MEEDNNQLTPACSRQALTPSLKKRGRISCFPSLCKRRVRVELDKRKLC